MRRRRETCWWQAREAGEQQASRQAGMTQLCDGGSADVEARDEARGALMHSSREAAATSRDKKRSRDADAASTARARDDRATPAALPFTPHQLLIISSVSRSLTPLPLLSRRQTRRVQLITGSSCYLKSRTETRRSDDSIPLPPSLSLSLVPVCGETSFFPLTPFHSLRRQQFS